jgi:hypothetical protein
MPSAIVDAIHVTECMGKIGFQIDTEIIRLASPLPFRLMNDLKQEEGINSGKRGNQRMQQTCFASANQDRKAGFPNRDSVDGRGACESTMDERRSIKSQRETSQGLMGQMADRPDTEVTAPFRDSINSHSQPKWPDSKNTGRPMLTKKYG